MRNIPPPILFHRTGTLSRNRLLNWLEDHQHEIYLRACFDDPQAVKLIRITNRTMDDPGELAVIYLLACIDEYRQALLN